MGRHWLEGRDTALFSVSTLNPLPTQLYGKGNPDAIFYTRRLATTRPLPAGEYQVYDNAMGASRLLCNAYSEVKRNIWSERITVTAPAGVAHEAFFDPVDIASAVGADHSDGVLNPTAFTGGGTGTTIHSLKWQEGILTMELSPAVSLEGHRMDFISLDGSTAFTVPFDEATPRNGGRTLMWSVHHQPWEDGDLLMLRVQRAAAAVPDTPERPSGQLTGAGTVSLGWNDVEGATSYRVRVWQENAYTELSADGAVNDISISFDGSAATVSGLPTGYTSYYFQVQAVNAAGASEWSPNNQIAVP